MQEALDDYRNVHDLPEPGLAGRISVQVFRQIWSLLRIDERIAALERDLATEGRAVRAVRRAGSQPAGNYGRHLQLVDKGDQ